MKTAEEYSKEWSNNPEIPFEDIIKKVQKEAYNQAIDDVSENVEIEACNEYQGEQFGY